MSLRSKADEYFSNLNCIAARIYVDMNETKTAYEELWSTLTPQEQDQILSESIIKPEISLKYGQTLLPDNKKTEYSVKLVVDDNYSYRDEHSAPFSFRTQSQRDLTIFKSSTNTNITLAHKRPKQNALNISKKSANEELISFAVQPSTAHLLPKTGLDLLDNW